MPIPRKPRANCFKCGAECHRKAIRYCSNQCQQDFEWLARKAEIKRAGKIDNGAPRTAKRYMLETCGHRCSICGVADWQGKPIPVVLDHIDGNASNWSLTNLRLVCGNGDMQLPTYKSKNRGKGRAWRRDRYAAGTSY
jgi:hypothetical protein